LPREGSKKVIWGIDTRQGIEDEREREKENEKEMGSKRKRDKTTRRERWGTRQREREKKEAMISIDHVGEIVRSKFCTSHMKNNNIIKQH